MLGYYKQQQKYYTSNKMNEGPPVWDQNSNIVVDIV